MVDRKIMRAVTPSSRSPRFVRVEPPSCSPDNQRWRGRTEDLAETGVSAQGATKIMGREPERFVYPPRAVMRVLPLVV